MSNTSTLIRGVNLYQHWAFPAYLPRLKISLLPLYYTKKLTYFQFSFELKIAYLKYRFCIQSEIEIETEIGVYVCKASKHDTDPAKDETHVHNIIETHIYIVT